MCLCGRGGGGGGGGGHFGICTEMSDINNGTRSDCISVQQPLRSLIMVLCTFNSSICDNHLSTAIYKYTTKY